MANVIDIADRFEPRARRALLAAFEAMRNRVPVGLIQRRLEGSGIGGVMRLLDGIEGDLGPVRDELRDAIVESGRATVGLMPGAAVLNPDFSFDLMNPATADFVRRYELNLIRMVSENTREAVRSGLMSDVVSGRNPIDTARTFRATVGLTPRQEQAVRNYRRALEELDRRALDRALRDKRFDRTVARAIDSERRLTAGQIDRLVSRYRERSIKHRSQTIARTEALRAATVGQQAAVQQMLAGGAIDGNRVRRFWVTTHDSRTRDAHRMVPGMNKDGVAFGESYQTPLGPLAFPRDPNGTGANTIQCRCTERFKLTEGPTEPAAVAEAKPKAKPKAKPRPKPKAKPQPQTPEQLRTEYERLRAEADSGKFRGRDLTVAQESASKARIEWAKTLGPDELRRAKAEVYRDMVRAPKALNLDDYAEKFETASNWVPFDLLEAMRLKGYTVNIRNQYNRRGLMAQGKKGKGFRAHAKNKHSYMARNDRGDEFAHEFGHQIDAFFSGNKIDRGAWTNRAFIGKDREGYRKFFEKVRGTTKGTYTNGDGQFWRDNWLRDYEGRIYPDSPDGLEFWAMNCQRYSLHRAGRTVKSVHTWDQVKRRYPGMAQYIEDLFGNDFIKG